MEVRITEGHDIRAVAEGAVRPGVWVGDGAAFLGLAGDVNLAAWERLSKLVGDEDRDQDQDEEDMSSCQPTTVEGAAVIERLRRDGLL